MTAILGFIIIALVTAISLVIISKLPLGIDIDSFGKAFVAGLIFGILNAIVGPVLGFLQIFNLLTLGLFGLIVNVIVFAIAAKLVSGFRLRWGFGSAVLGAIALSIINSILFRILEAFSIYTLPAAG